MGDLELVELSLKGPSRRRYLELLVHRIGGATTGDCTALARHVRDLIDTTERWNYWIADSDWGD